MPGGDGKDQPCRCGKHLTKREVDVLMRVAAENDNAEIAQALRVSVRTVEAHVTSMLHKVEARNRAGLIARCYASGILLPGLPPKWSGSTCLKASAGRVPVATCVPGR
jgi:DNA-binding CsgD family transcriptional regulator